MELLHLTKILLRWWWVVVLSAVAGGLIALGLSQQIDPVYESSSSFMVTVRSGDVRPDEQRIVAGTYLQLVYQRPVLAEVIDRLNLDMSVSHLEEIIEASFVEQDTLLVEVTVQDSDPQRAASIANEVFVVLSEQGRQFLNSDQLASRALLRVVEIALPPDGPITPNTTRNVLFGIIIGVMLSGGALILIEVLDTTIRSDDRVRHVTGLDTFAAIPRISSLSFGSNMPVLSAPSSAIVETYRLLRARIDYAAADKPMRTLVISSSMPQEGKSTVAANLAVILAQSGKRVILVDANLRQPGLHKFFKRSNKEQGLTAALQHVDDDNLDRYLVPTDVANLRLLPAGPQPTNPAELLGSAHLAALIDSLTARADIVLFDSSPVLSAVDPMLLAQIADATLLVVNGEHTKARELEQAHTQLGRFGVQPLGVVLNYVTEDVASFRKVHHHKPGTGRWGLLNRLSGRQSGGQPGKTGETEPANQEPRMANARTASESRYDQDIVRTQS